MYVIEGWGTGVRRMIKACRNHGVQEPVFTEIGTDFRVEFFRKNTVTDEHVNEHANEHVKIDTELVAKYPELSIIMTNPNITINEMAMQLQLGRATVTRHITVLKKMGILTREGSDKTGYWKITREV